MAVLKPGNDSPVPKNVRPLSLLTVPPVQTKLANYSRLLFSIYKVSRHTRRVWSLVLYHVIQEGSGYWCCITSYKKGLVTGVVSRRTRRVSLLVLYHVVQEGSGYWCCITSYKKGLVTGVVSRRTRRVWLLVLYHVVQEGSGYWCCIRGFIDCVRHSQLSNTT